MKKSLLLTLLLLVHVCAAWAADKVITGNVIADDDKQPLIGVSVYVSADDLKKAGSSLMSLGVVTDIDGNFSITVPSGVKKLQLSYIGYTTQQIELSGQTHYNVALQPSSTMLNDVVVTGYQTVERRKLTAAVAKIDISEGRIGTVKSIDQALSGQIAGLSAVSTSGAPGSPVKIRIRGTSSLNGTQDPLWVLDGIPLEGTDIPSLESLKNIDDVQQSPIAGLNPADIADITVLKDAAATAIYGARAANGVIVITTKNGKAGKTKINFSTRLTWSPQQNIDRLNLLNASEKVDLELQLMKSDYAMNAEKGEIYRILNRYNAIDAFKKDGWDALSKEAQNEINALRLINTDWNDILLQDAFSQEYNLSLSGGNEKATYYTSLGYSKEQGNIPNVSSDRLNLVMKANYKVNRMLKFGTSVFVNRRKNGSYLSTDGFTNPMFYARIANPYLTPYDKDGNYVYDSDIQNGNSDLLFNTFEERQNTSNETTINSLSSIFDVELRFDDRFKITSQVGLQLDKTSREQIADQESFAMRLEHKNHRYNGTSFLPQKGGFHKAYENSDSQVTWKTMGTYRDTYADIHEFEIMVGSELRRTWATTLYSAGYGYDRRTMTNQPVVFPSDSQAFPLHTKTNVENAYVSAFSTMSYSLLNRYTLGGSIRFDGSDLFGVDKKYRYLPLYSVSALWRISEEPFTENAKWLDNLVIRASYGLQGNIDKNTSPYLLGKYQSNATPILPGNTEDMIVVTSAPNDKLRWEKTHSVNVGLDFAVLNQAINLSVDYYYRKGVDLIGMQMLPLETGFSSTNINWASMTNKGIEIGLSTRNIHTKSFMWTTTFNFAYNQNKVLKEAIREDAIYPSREGYPAGAIFAFPYAGIDENGQMTFYNKETGKVESMKEFFKVQEFGFGTYNLSHAELRNKYEYIGTTDSPYTGGFNNTFTYKAWELGINCIFNAGGYVRVQPSYSLTSFDRGQNTNRDILNRWTPENPNGTMPALVDSNTDMDAYFFLDGAVNPYAYSSLWVKKQNYMRIQSIRLGYELPFSLIQKLGISQATVALEGRNLFVFGSSYRNYLDPETMGNPYAQPIPKSFTFSLNLNF
ncbi:SusC/RagA family TonB-linked outer membrane protein [Phocaeicola coprocola]|uniref:SusC/RagA family TonB-linked outer membrane protein n=1 Tax=Phocaeicola coprocola TaxID=310298 RepID=UPI0022E9741F|nr:SusC/RagA family TonB-linked outer membrane protein [Phocaeicola coprocola]